MKKFFFFFSLIFLGCSVESVSVNVKNFAKCYISKIPAPFWICYQSNFEGIGKVKTDKVDEIKEEEAYFKAKLDLIEKLISKIDFCFKLQGKNLTTSLQDRIKNFILLNANEEKTFYLEKTKTLYAKVYIDKKLFKEFLQKELNCTKNLIEDVF